MQNQKQLPAHRTLGRITIVGSSRTGLSFSAQGIAGVDAQPDPEPSEDAEGKEPRAGDIRSLRGGLAELSRSGLTPLTGANVLALTIQPRPLC
jgi:hypothetical protein